MPNNLPVTGMCEDCNDITKISLYKVFASLDYVVGSYPIGEHYFCNECANKIKDKESM